MKAVAAQSTSDSAPARKQQKAAAPLVSVSPWLIQPVSVSAGPVVQRKAACACGGGCPSCEQETNPETIQTKLTVSTPGDEYEREADHVAEQVMRMTEPHVVGEVSTTRRTSKSLARRKCAAGEVQEHRAAPDEEETLQAKEINGSSTHVGPEVQAQIDGLRGGGQPLSQSARAFFEPRFGYDFSQVRIHADGPAAESARRVSALAYTVGQDIVLGAGQTSYETPGGMRLLAHELTHVMQQGGGQSLVGLSSLTRVPSRALRMVQRATDASVETSTGVGAGITSGTMVPDNSIMGHTLAASTCRGLYGCNINFEFGKAYKGVYPYASAGRDVRGVYVKISASFNSSVCGTCGTVQFIQDFRNITRGATGVETAEETEPTRRARSGWSDPHAPSRGWAVDQEVTGPDSTNPLYTPSWVGNSGTSTTPAVLWDTPGAWTTERNAGGDLQSCAVCENRGVQRKVLACVNWGYYIDSTGVISFRPAAPVATCGPTQELQDATTRWEGIAGNLPANIDFARESPVDQRGQSSVLWFRHNSIALRQDAEIDSAIHMADALLRIRQHLAVGANSRIVLHGYASEEGDAGYNMQLSRRRAETIQAKLIAAGIPPNRITIQAHGEDRTLPTRAYNRRVEIEHTVVVPAGAAP